MSRPRLWTKDFLIDAITNFMIYLVYYLLIVTITVYAMDDLRASESEAGLASGIFILGALVSRVFTGRSIDRVGRKRTLVIALSFYLFATLLYFVSNSLFVLYLIRFLHGAGFGMASTATGTIAASVIPDERRGEGTSYYAMSVTLASAIGPLLGMFLEHQGNFNVILVMCIILLLVGFIAIMFLKVPEVKLTVQETAELKSFRLNNFFESKAVPISIIAIFIGLAYSSLLSFLATYVREIDMATVGSFFFMVYAISILVSRPLSGNLFDRKGESFIMYPAFFLFAIGLVVLGLAHHGIYILLAAAIIGLGYGTFLSSAQAIAIKVSPPNRMGLATSTYFIFIDGGVGIGPFLLGLLIPLIGLRGMYLSMALVVGFCAVLYYFLHGKKAAKHRKNSFAESQTICNDQII